MEKGKDKVNSFKSKKSYVIRDSDELKTGNCVVCIKNRNTGSMRYSSGAVIPIPYTKDATAENKAQFGKNLVFVIYGNDEDIVGYYQNRSKRANKEIRNANLF